MDKNNIQEEVTITPIIRDLERLINKIVRLLILFFEYSFRCVKQFFLFVLKNKSLFIAAIFIGSIVGFLSPKFYSKTFSSHLVIDLRINAKYQLFSDINYLNSLVQRGQYEELSKVLKVSREEAENFKEFNIKPLYSYVRSVHLLNGFYQDLDTAVRNNIDQEKILSKELNEDLSDRFIIQAFSTSENVFADIEVPMITFLERVPELHTERKSSIERLLYQKKIYKEEIVKLDTLSKVMNQVLLSQAKSNTNSGTSINLGKPQESSTLNPLEIYNKKIEFAEQIVDIDNTLQYLNTCYYVKTHFSNYGTKNGPGRFFRSLIGAFIFFCVTSFFVALNSLKKE